MNGEASQRTFLLFASHLNETLRVGGNDAKPLSNHAPVTTGPVAGQSRLTNGARRRGYGLRSAQS